MTMQNKPRLKCFIAMAFDREDTDLIYSKVFKPILKDGKRNIKPIRIDKITHNDDIDEKIISELKECDFVIADLTYARPSVYFEAGFAQRSVPVIYTCRSDHFKPQQADPLGNLKVHFDLQMKNIIKWKSFDDKTFKINLGARISHVTKPIYQKLERISLKQGEENAFQMLSLNEKHSRIYTSSINILNGKGFNTDKSNFHSLKFARNYKQGLIDLTKTGNILREGLIGSGRKYFNHTLYTSTIIIASSLNKSFYHELNWFFINQILHNLIPQNGKANKVKMYKEDIVLCCLSKINKSVYAKYFPSQNFVSENQSFTSRSLCPTAYPLSNSIKYVYQKYSPAQIQIAYSKTDNKNFSIATIINPKRTHDIIEDGQYYLDDEENKIAIFKTVPIEFNIKFVDNIRSIQDFENKLNKVL